MVHDDYAYFLTVTGASTEDRMAIDLLLKQDEYFSGCLRKNPFNDPNHVIFDCNKVGGSISELDQEEVAQTMHKLAMLFPAATFHLQAENVDDKSKCYEIKTHQNLYQHTEMVSYMPNLSSPVPFESRSSFHDAYTFNNIILEDTDWSSIYAQKNILAESLRTGTVIPANSLNQLIQFLDDTCSWAERSGLFTQPSPEKGVLEKTESPSQQLSREDLIGKELYISSTDYFHGELFISQLSRCNGAAEDGSRLRFASDHYCSHMNLGCAYDRPRSEVFLSQKDILNYLEKQMDQVSKENPLTRDYPFLLLEQHHGLTVHFVKPSKDYWTGQFYLETPNQVGFSFPEHFATNCPYVVRNHEYQIFNRNDLNGLSKALADKMRPYFPEQSKTKALADHIRQAELTQKKTISTASASTPQQVPTNSQR